MKIAFFLSNYPVLSETFVVRQIRGMIDLGHQVTIITGQHDLSVDDPLSGAARIVSVRANTGGSSPIAQLLKKSVRLLLGAQSGKSRRRIRAGLTGLRDGIVAPIVDILSVGEQGLGHFDAIIAHFGPAGVRAMYLRDAGLISGPIATVFHGLDVTEHGLVKKFLPHYRRLFTQTEALLPISELWKKKLISWGADPAMITVHRMGVDVSDFPMPQPRRGAAGPLRLLTTARFVQKKGLIYAINAMCAAPGDSHLSIIGYGPLEKELREAAAACPARVTFLGKIPHREVLAELKRSDVFLLPSVVADNGDMEGIPVSLMEAMALGVITVSTWHSGIPELIDDGVEGFLVEERNAGQIADIITTIESGEVDLASMRVAARAKIEREFDNRELDTRLEQIAFTLAGIVPAAEPARVAEAVS
ncbi:colanic acid/amylovoran biosynthesis glycosyltransferase [Sphingomonas aerolata]|uniref:Colanic acid/amylovoran biosynthesis glycosyltransferase n=1 Tax=Sphingomonas aerolata TaxID=185951 RepID=A0A2T4YSB8_9SPHN|nr:glycosyltransferase [Sphingomonas aerolata]PTM46707.1 colanic acid/amylovoran biosynthesis glycosyltransferase [Sphingomonas aerolata]